MKRLDEITIADLMPDSISGDLEVSATARAIDPQLRLISEAVDKPLILAAIDDLSAGVLEHLAVQYDVTAWDSAWPIETKRAVLKTAIADKRKMGTRGAVQRAIEAVAPIATITEWWQDTSGEMPPHTFKIDLLQEESAVDAETQANVIAQVNEAKPVRSHYTFTAIQQAGSGFYFAGVLRAIAYARVRSAGITIEQTNIQAGICAALRGMNIRRLLASSHMGEMPEPVVPDVALFGGDFSGNKITMESVDGGGSLIDKYAHSKALFELRGWSPGGDFTEYQALGGILTGTSDEAMWIQAGSMGGVIDEYIPVPENPTMYVNLGLRWNAGNSPASWLSKTFAARDWWWSGILSYDDKAALESFGNSIISYTSSDHNWAGQIGALHYEPGHFSYKLVDMFSDVGSGSVPFNPTNFYFDRYAYPSSDSTQYCGCMRIWSINAFNTLVKTYRVKITNNFPNDTNSTFVLLGMKFNSSNSEWINVTFATIDDDGWWAGILDLTDQTKIVQLNLLENTSYPFDEVLYSPNYDYEVIGVYTDFGNTLLPGFDPANFYVAKSQNYNVICIYSHTVISTPVKTWLCKITPKAPSDSVTGTISALTLPTAHNGSYTDVTFESLRYYAKGTLSNTGFASQATYFGLTRDWYYGTLTWTDESLGDLSSKIDVADPASSNTSYQSILRLHFILDGPISGYHADDALGSNYGYQIAAYSYSVGVHSITLYSPGINWYSGAYSGRIMIRYVDGATSFKKLSAFDLVNVSSGTLSKTTTTDRYDMYNVWNGDITVIAKYNG